MNDLFFDADEVTEAYMKGNDLRTHCPHCGSVNNYKMLKSVGPYRNSQLIKVLLSTMKCKTCETTWTVEEALD